MSREIKFRAWDKKSKRMVNDLGFALVYEKLKRAIGMFNWDDIVPMQYTGLKDRNGREIWEGDIMRWNDYCVKVIWGNSRWEFEAANGDHMVESFSGFADEYEVIGNIYEHPHLLESGIIRNKD